MTSQRRFPQRAIGVDDPLWADVHAIARRRGENVSALVRGALSDYRDAHAHVLLEARAQQSDDLADAVAS